MASFGNPKFPFLSLIIVVTVQHSVRGNFTIPTFRLNNSMSVDQDLCLFNMFDWFPYKIEPQSQFTSLEMTMYLESVSTILESEDTYIDSVHTQTTMKEYMEMIPNLNPSQFYKLVAFERIHSLYGQFLFWCRNVIEHVNAYQMGQDPNDTFVFDVNYFSPQLYEYASPGIVIFPGFKGKDFNLSDIYLHFVDVEPINMPTGQVQPNRTYFFDSYINRLSEMLLVEMLLASSSGSSQNPPFDVLHFISDLFNESFTRLENETHSLPLATVDMFFTSLNSAHPMNILNSLSHEVAKFEDTALMYDSGISVNCDNHYLFTRTDCETCQQLLQPPSSFHVLVIKLDFIVQQYYDMLHNTHLELVEYLYMLFDGPYYITNTPQTTTATTTTTPMQTTSSTPPSTQISSTTDAERSTESMSRLSSQMPSSLAATSHTVSSVKQKSTMEMTSSVQPSTTQVTTMQPSTTEITSSRPSPTELHSVRSPTTEVSSMESSTTQATSIGSSTTQETSMQPSTTSESLKTTTGVETTSDLPTSSTQGADATMESTMEGVTGHDTTGASNTDTDADSGTTMETEHATGPGHTTTDEETESTTTEETDENEEQTEGGQNNQDDPTEGTPETKEYRASELLNEDTMRLVLNGNEDEKHISLDFYSQNGDFDGVKKEDFTFTFENVKSFKNKANIRASVTSVSARNFGIDVYVDSSASWTLMMAVKGTTIKESSTENPLTISFKVKHSAPICNRRRFTDTGNAIEFGFDVPVNVTRTADGGCTDFFQDTNGLGDGATCDMKTPRLLVVTIGRGSNLIEPGGTLTFKTDAIKPARQLFYDSLNNGYSIEGPDNPPRPSFTIAGPVTINRCGTYKLRAEQITGHGGRPIKYRWQLQTLVAHGSGLNSDYFHGLNEGDGSPVLTLDAADLLSGQQYNFALEITNFLGQAEEQVHTLSVIDDVKPVLEIKPINVIPNRVRVSSRVKLEAEVTYSFGDDCESSINAPTYEWSGPDGLIPVDRRDGRVLVLPPNTLPVNEATEITVTVTSTQGSSNTVATTVTETITLTTIASPLVAHINGASKLTLGPQDSVLLDGSRSHDPDEIGSEGLTYQWTCLPKASSQPCDNSLGDELTTSKVLVQASQFDAGTYYITLLVSKGARTATVSVTVIITMESVPTIKIKTRSGRIKFRDNENVYIQANINSSSAVTVAWSELNDRFDPELWEFGDTFRVPGSTEYRTHVKIPFDQTTAGSQYTLEVEVTDQNGKSGLAALDFSIYQPITQCEVQATPYTEMKEITITATGCVADPDLQPLTYQPVFAVRLDDGYKKIVLGRQKGASSQTVIATPIEFNGENVTVGFEVCDTNSTTCINAFTTTRYESTAVLSDTEREQFIAEKIDKELETGNVVTAFSNSINIVNMQKKQLQSERRKKRDQFSQFSAVYGGDLDSLFLVVEKIEFNENEVIKSQFDEVGSKQAEVLQKVGPSDSNEGAAILDLTALMVQSTFTEDDIDETVQAVDRIFDTAKEEGYRHSKETMERTFTTLASSSTNLKDTSTEEKKTELRQKIRDLRKAGLKQLGQDLSIGDHVTLDISGTKVSVVCFLPEKDTAIDEGADLPVTIRPGGSLSDRYLYDWCTEEGDDVCSGLKGLVIPVTELEEEITNCSNLTDITLVNPVTDADVPVSNLDDPIEIEMATMQLEDGQTCVCKYWNEETSQLESEGVTSETTADGKLICKSRHLTAFVGEVTYDTGQDQDPGPTKQGGSKTPSNGQLGVILGIVFGVLGVILLVIIVGAVIFKVTQQKKVTPDGE